MKLKKIPLGEVYRLLEPGPVVMMTTAAAGKEDIMTTTWHTMMEFEPPLIGIVISGHNHSFDLLAASRECVICIPTVELAKITVKVGNTSGRNIDKFKKFGLTRLPAYRVKAPLVTECYANLECLVVDSSWVGKYNFFVLKVVRAWIDQDRKKPRFFHHSGKGYFAVDGKTIKLPSKMK
jgi:flavin reductase (DIM6/NTAB) family NADH-FMN oxidoreductase RutF